MHNISVRPFGVGVQNFAGVKTASQVRELHCANSDPVCLRWKPGLTTKEYSAAILRACCSVFRISVWTSSLFSIRVVSCMPHSQTQISVAAHVLSERDTGWSAARHAARLKSQWLFMFSGREILSKRDTGWSAACHAARLNLSDCSCSQEERYRVVSRRPHSQTQRAR